MRAGRYLPYGFFSDPSQSVASTVMPQYWSALMALNGLDWKGSKLNGDFGPEPTQGQKFGASLEAFFGATVPVASQIQQVATKQGPIGQRLERQFNPFYPVQNTQKGGGVKSSPLDSPIDKHLGNLNTDPSQFDSAIDKALAK